LKFDFRFFEKNKIFLKLVLKIIKISMEPTSMKSYSVIGIGNTSIDIIGKIGSSDVKRFNLIEGKTNNADESNIDFLEHFEQNQNSSDLKYLASGSATNTIKVINVNYK